MGNNFCSSKHPRPLTAHRLTDWDGTRVLQQGPLTHSPNNTRDLWATMPPILALLTSLRRSWTSHGAPSMLEPRALHQNTYC